MNKLNSKNPVLRFKLGKLILFALGGSGRWFYNGKEVFSDDGGKTFKLNSSGTLTGAPGVIKNLVKADKVGKGAYKVGNNWYKIGGNGKPAVFKKLEQATLNVKPVTKSSVTKPTVKPKTTTVSPHFMKGYENVLPEIGGELNIKSMLLKIKSFYAPGTYKDDGIWGKNTLAAYEKYLLSLTPVKQETKPQSWFTSLTAQTIPSTTNFGYRTDNTYEGNDFSDRLKGLGIGSNADLINWMYSTGANNYDWKGNTWAKLFRSDVNQALGGDYSDANIRKTFNIGGNWGRGFLGGGDISDFQKALQTNAGVWNGRYDLKRDNFMKSQPMLNLINNYFANGSVPYSNWRNNLAASKNLVFDRGNLFKAEKGGQLISNNPIKRFKTSIPKHLFGSILLNNDFKLRNQLKQLFVDKPVELVKQITKPMEKSTEKAAKKNKNIAALLLQLWNSGAFNGVIDKKTGKLVTYERAVDGINGSMTRQAMENNKKMREAIPLSPRDQQVLLNNLLKKTRFITSSGSNIPSQIFGNNPVYTSNNSKIQPLNLNLASKLYLNGTGNTDIYLSGLYHAIAPKSWSMPHSEGLKNLIAAAIAYTEGIPSSLRENDPHNMNNGTYIGYDTYGRLSNLITTVGKNNKTIGKYINNQNNDNNGAAKVMGGIRYRINDDNSVDVEDPYGFNISRDFTRTNSHGLPYVYKKGEDPYLEHEWKGLYHDITSSGNGRSIQNIMENFFTRQGKSRNNNIHFEPGEINSRNRLIQ